MSKSARYRSPSSWSSVNKCSIDTRCLRSSQSCPRKSLRSVRAAAAPLLLPRERAIEGSLWCWVLRARASRSRRKRPLPSMIDWIWISPTAVVVAVVCVVCGINFFFLLVFPSFLFLSSSHFIISRPNNQSANCCESFFPPSFLVLSCAVPFEFRFSLCCFCDVFLCFRQLAHHPTAS